MRRGLAFFLAGVTAVVLLVMAQVALTDPTECDCLEALGGGLSSFGAAFGFFILLAWSIGMLAGVALGRWDAYRREDEEG